MGTLLKNYIETNQKVFHEELTKHVRQLDIPTSLKKSMLYSLEAGGKRLRPILLLASFEAYASNVEKTYRTASALEMIHTYSLIHDDLPAMDDDDYRRGLLTNHKVFGEATAILAGDALLTFSFEMITNDALLSNSEKVYLIQLLAQASGPTGMVAGQILDMEAENQTVTIEMLEKIHALKTGELLRFAVTAGAYLGNATKEQISYLQDFAHYLGLIFQVQDDILDVTGDEQKLGKAVGSDESNNKSTYPKLLGLDGAIEMKKHYIEKAKELLKKANADTSRLADLTDYFSERDH
ncbi:polyprenyl synthetase family protein [Ornithinibacillus sp. BX22]|uniref:Farnesyl diphosphate synthase n=2 Tax=Ornithinibacillus TaxID=484508 RepID=A0A923L6A7_9BACI|nr:polyprenyl synthetase family protein [Ornithinibacillus hominis]MBS3679624.1 polyprenyl synthetase family protein [Ornithinibacillus massiliensis]